MPLDPQVKAIVDQVAALNMPAFHQLTPQQARAQSEAMRPKTTGEPVAKVEDRTIPGLAGQIPIRIYTPAGQGPFGALLFYHGGGWVIGTLDGSDAVCRTLANGAGCVVLSVDYRMAPEDLFPAAADDCYAAVTWVADNAAQLNIDRRRIAVSGVSAGGNLAAVVALMARDQGGPAIAHQLLVVPVTDYNFETPSYSENADGPQLTRDSMRWFWKLYAPDEERARHPYASPLRAESLSGLPPAHVLTAQYDPLRDEGKAYADRLRSAGVPVTYTSYEGMTHGFFGMFAGVDRARAAVQDACTELKQVFAAQPV